ncbi:lipase family protein [Nocardia brasiliensis]|uniref:Putative lipase n=1 Tax=Nocardia brasiliensis (strain ATCC 700358 / HUJEG-1) TaxID=1133849 RepID=K0F8L0_NOCB7|nr:lipase family protein [Nocardia brasiliensis]AFU06074.1 putative lipase [Nocardia brasiliensis ATCC 700358]OCF88719.1 lipase [Nocardia brasiliensis]
MKRLTVAVATAAALLLSAATAAAEQGPQGTPGLDKVFNGFVVGQIQNAQPVPPDQAFQALLANDPFYEEPPLTGAEQPGTLLKAKKVDVMFLGITPPDIEAYKLMYVTTGIDGVTPMISTGILMIPNHGVPVGEKKVVSYQEANDSVGWSCHPSTQWTGGDPLDGSSWSALGPLALMFDKGYAVMISDVGNDGDRKPHGVFAGKFAAHAQLDGVRAALGYQEAGLNPKAPISLFGIAGGGVGAAFSAELQPTYAPELDVKTAVLEGMVVNPRNFMRVADGSVGSGFALATLLGLEPAYPEMRVNEKLNPAGVALADAFRTQCQTPAYFGLPFLPLNTLFNSGLSPADEPAFQHAFEENILGRAGTPKAKVAITSCAADDSPMSLVPAKDSRELADIYRAGGADVVYQPTDCSMTRMLTDIYGWGTDLFGMQTIDWIDRNFD